MSIITVFFNNNNYYYNYKKSMSLRVLYNIPFNLKPSINHFIL